MHFSTILTVLAAAGSALAYPYYEKDNHNNNKNKHHGHNECLPAGQVDTIVSNYQALVGNIKSLSPEQTDKMLTADFVDRSNSINAFFSLPYDQPTFVGRDAFVTAQRNARQMPIVVESVPAHTCDTVVLIWNAMFPSGKSRGISVVGLDKEDGCWKISSIDVEFNSLAWAVGLGGGYQIFGNTVGNITPQQQQP